MHGLNIKIKYINLGNVHFVGLCRIITMHGARKHKNTVCILSVAAINLTFQAVIMSLLYSFLSKRKSETHTSKLSKCTPYLIHREIYASVTIPTVTETVRLNRLRWFGHVQRMGGNRISKRVLYMNLGTTGLRGRPRNRWQDGVREDGRIVGEKVHNREE